MNTRRRKAWLRATAKYKPHTSSEFKTSHTGLVMGVEGRMKSPTSGWSSEKRWKLSVNPEARKAS